MNTLEIRRGERCQVFDLLDAEFTAGCGDNDALRLTGEGVGPHQLRFVRTELGYRVEPGRDGAALVVNGVAVARRELRHGDRLAIGPLTIAYREDGKPWPVDPEPVSGGLDLKIAPIAAKKPSLHGGGAASRAAEGARRAHTAVGEGGAARRAAKRGGAGKPWILWNLLLVIAVVAFLVIRSLLASRGEHDARDLVTLAESQHRALDHESALATLALALERFPADPLRPRIVELQRAVRIAMQLRLDLPLIRAAESARIEIDRVVLYYLAKEPNRPAAREVVRLADAWLAAHGALADRSPEVAELKRLVTGARETWSKHAGLGEPDTADDVLFVAERKLRFERRRYLDAFALLDAWLAGPGASASAADQTRVRTRKQEMHDDGPRWIVERRAAIERMLQLGQRDRAREELEALVEDKLVPAEWLGDAAEKLRALRG